MKTIKLGTEMTSQKARTQGAVCGSTRRGFLARTLALLLVASMAWLPSISQAGAVPGVGGKKSVNVYFSNTYIGALIDQMLLVDFSDMQEVIQAATLRFVEMVQSDPSKRMDAIAAEIMARNAEVVGLVELYQLQVAELGSADFVSVYDYLDLLQQALAARGGHYQAAVVTKESDVALPVFLDGRVKMARLVDHEAILVRTDLPPGQLSYSNPQTGHFEHHIVIPAAGMDLLRGWCSIDMTVRGERFLMLCTHLETEAVPQLQYAQALELLAGPANTTRPVLLIGDFNTDPFGRDGSFTYPLFGQAGFTDSWNVLNPQDPLGGLTWGHDPYLSDSSVLFDRRIDLILYRGTQFTATSLEVIDPLIGTSKPLWYSDHAGLSAALQLGNPKSVK
jgi:endonuclease/exonuclease/phosphatase family metal-dependent hydrolase